MADSKQVKQIKDAIVDGYRRGVCNKEGESVKNQYGMPVPKPRVLPRRIRRK